MRDCKYKEIKWDECGVGLVGVGWKGNLYFNPTRQFTLYICHAVHPVFRTVILSESHFSSICQTCHCKNKTARTLSAVNKATDVSQSPSRL